MKLSSGYILFFLLLFLSNQPVISQSMHYGGGNRYFSVGDTIPDIRFEHLVNYPSSTAKLSDFKEKLILLDFWVTGCSACVEGFPKLITLQKKFEDKVRVILVNAREDENRVKQFYKQRIRIGKENNPLATECKASAIQELFKIRSTPSYVWIDSARVIRAITLSPEVTEQNIDGMLHHTISRLPDATQPYVDLNYHLPLFANGGSGAKLISGSVLSGFIGAEPVYGMDSIGRQGHIYAIDQSIADLYRLAYRSSGVNVVTDLVDLRVLKFEGIDTIPYFAAEGQKNKLYSYQLTSGERNSKRLCKMMQDDLFRYFGLDVNVENRKTKCLVLTADDPELVLYSKGSDFYRTTYELISFNKVPISILLDFLRNISNGGPYLAYPILDETGINGDFGHIECEADVHNFRSIDRALKSYKMHFTVQEREIPLLIIRAPKASHY